MSIRLHPSWKSRLSEEFEKPYFKELTDFVRQEYQSRAVYPPPANIFKALDECPFDEVKVVILGQDPYHGAGQANGLCFSVGPEIPLPPSLKNIYKEIADDLSVPAPETGDLSRWAKQGVLLLNATLTVAAKQAGSHQNKGWETFTDAIIQTLSDQKKDVVFLLWGRYAQSKSPMIDPIKHLVLTAPHPSPLSAHRGFFGCKHFSRTNEYLESVGQSPVQWA